MDIAPGVRYLTRRDWGANPAYPRKGYAVTRDKRTHVTFHHTVSIDRDATPNVWETLDEVKAKMRQLQVIRPDLGNDVPYSFVFFLMADGTIIVCEGRGYDRTGAHTHGHNTDGMGLAGAGNFELARNIGPWLPEINGFLWHLKYEANMRNLEIRPHPIPPNRVCHGHRDFKSTACPGRNVFNRLPEMKFEKKEDDTMKAYRIEGRGPQVWGYTIAQFWRMTGEEFREAKELGLKTPLPLMSKAKFNAIRKRLHMD
jgi:hypothetical protein